MASFKNILAMVFGILLATLTHPTSASPIDSTLINRDVTFGDLSLQSMATQWYSSDYSTGATVPSNPDAAYSCLPRESFPSGWPEMTQWISYDDMLAINKPIMEQVGDSDPDIGTMDAVIRAVSEQSHVDARLILATIMQESTGNLSVQCTGLDVNGDGQPDNCGIMQAGAGSQKYNPSPSPYDGILLMIQEGVFGTSPAVSKMTSGVPGLAAYLNGVSWIAPQYWGNPYAAARMYNAGGIYGENDSGAVYANDIAMRLLGWNGGNAGYTVSQTCN